jgi:hypothetical protein
MNEEAVEFRPHQVVDSRAGGAFHAHATHGMEIADPQLRRYRHLGDVNA